MARHHSNSMFLTPPMAAPAAFVFRKRAVGPEAALEGRGAQAGEVKGAPRCQASCPGPRTVHTDLGPPSQPRMHGPLGQPGSPPPSYPPNLSTMALRFCARGPRGRAGADTLRSGTFSFFSPGGEGSVGLWGTSLGDDSLRGETRRSVRGTGTPVYRTQGGGWTLHYNLRAHVRWGHLWSAGTSSESGTGRGLGRNKGPVLTSGSA